VLSSARARRHMRPRRSRRRCEWEVPRKVGKARAKTKESRRSHRPPQEKHAKSESTLETNEKLSSGMHTKHCHLHTAAATLTNLNNVLRPKGSSHPHINRLVATVDTDDVAGTLRSQGDGARARGICACRVRGKDAPQHVADVVYERSQERRIRTVVVGTILRPSPLSTPIRTLHPRCNHQPRGRGLGRGDARRT
jgi:hypothetical protein